MMSALEAVLSAIASDRSWCESSGDGDAPTGHFARVSIDNDVLALVVSEFAEVIVTYEMADIRSLIGHWLIVSNSVGHVYPTSFDDEASLIAAYDELEAEFSKWDDESEDNV